ncbi:sensor histidine kinase [Flavihumibacter solisilvae]|uniref:Histidine kinase domain-containing protein n=1 Tax=Flavihumibacter solisilvae TaxID=1349421 RepID=A0A0C1IHL7_9BACT|nr:two-component regulator propeller domain-containing protein [Flavihumibacter solisilvae]KIC93705.1 hypothetical protein OI18_16265 [Flavihumibacter solisilvae]
MKPLPFAILLSALACTQKEEVKTSLKTLKPAIGVINKDSTVPPVITLIDKSNAPGKVLAGKPEVHQVPGPGGLGLPNFTHYNTEQGLPLSFTWWGYKDKNGNLWFGTDGGGVSRYDGKSFTNFNTTQGLAGYSVYDIKEDKAGKFWFATGNGVSCYDGKSFTNFTVADGLPDDVVYSIAVDRKGNLWFTTNSGGVSRYDGKSFKNYTTKEGLAGNTVFGVTEDKNGKLWFGTNEGASCFDGQSFTNFTTAQGLPHNSVINILEDKTGKLWFATGKGISRYDGKSFTNFTRSEGLAGNTVVCITEDKSGNLWFGTFDGVSRYDGNTFTNFTTAQGLTNNVVRSITEDNAGNLWMGTNEGLNRYDGTAFTNFSTAEGLANNAVRNIIEDKNGSLWFGTAGGGVSRFDGRSFSNFTTAQGLAHNTVLGIAEDDAGKLWFGTLEGLSCYDGRSFTNFTKAQGLVDNNAWGITKDKTGKLWIATHSGVSCYSGRSFTNFTTAQGLVDNHVQEITEDKKGNLWFATRQGVSRYDGVSFTNFTTAHGLVKNDVMNITEDERGNLWFGTISGGLSRYDGTSFLNFTSAQGLATNDVWALVIDRQGNIFIGNNIGIGVLKGFKSLSSDGQVVPAVNALLNEELKNYLPVFELYSKETGYPVKDPHPNAMFADSKGMIWEGGLTLVRFDYNALLRNSKPPAVFIQSVKINGNNIGWTSLANKDSTGAGLDSQVMLNEEILSFGRELFASERDSLRQKFSGISFDSISPFYPVPQNLVLPYKHNSISFDFLAIEPARNYLVKYQYILEGYEKEWSPVGKTASVTYGNIPEGAYVFKLRAQGPSGIWSGSVAFPFEVLPPWYRTWWAYALYLLAFVFALWSFAKWRVQAVEKEKKVLEEKVISRTKELEQSLEEKYRLSKTVESQQALLNERLRISRELHDDIGSTLGSISIYSEVAKKRTEKNEAASDVLSKIGLASREIIDKMSDIVWSLNPDNDNFEQLQNRMMTFAAMMLTPRNILYDFVADNELKNLRLTSEQRKNIFLIFKETLYNTVKYAECSRVRIILNLRHNDLAMVIKDNGKGFDIAGVAVNGIPAGEYVGGNGIKNMYARADEMKANLEIKSKSEEGTTVQLIVKL